jgi:hypothetical protein
MRYVSLLTLAGITACASGYGSGPPGGREDHIAPKIVKVIPDTNATRATPRAMVVEFDGVISERPAGLATSLADLVLISPRDGQPNVDWHRDNITIRPRHGWRDNTTYTVTILPGIADLHNNVANTTSSFVFSTGAAIPATTLSGTVFDWMRSTPLMNAMIEAMASRDTTLVYVGTTDSLGRFALRGLAPGSYRVRALDDQNHNHELDPREAFDTTTVALTTTSWVELLTFAHDTAGPRLSNVTVQDSVTLHLFFETPIDPNKTLEATSFTLIGADSSRVAITDVTPVYENATVQPSPSPVTPSGPPVPSKPPVPSGPPAPPKITTPRPSKPQLYREVKITAATPLRPKASYTLRASNIRGPTGRVANSDRTFAIPAPPPPDTTKAAAQRLPVRPTQPAQPAPPPRP